MKFLKSVLTDDPAPVYSAKKARHQTRSMITFTSDFGLKDYFVGAVKGVLSQQAPEAALVDITHALNRHDIVSAAFVVKESFSYFPKGSIHLVVVDPGVGTARKKLLLDYRRHLFVGPDNGVFSYLLKDKKCRVYEMRQESLYRSKKSSTFAGRDHFAPIAAALANGAVPTDLGRELKTAKIIKDLFCRKVGSQIKGRIVYFDIYGNAITNITQTCLKDRSLNFELGLPGQPHRIQLKSAYSRGKPGKGNLIINSSGHLEIFVPNDSAQQRLKLKLLDEVMFH